MQASELEHVPRLLFLSIVSVYGTLYAVSFYYSFKVVRSDRALCQIPEASPPRVRSMSGSRQPVTVLGRRTVCLVRTSVGVSNNAPFPKIL